MARPKYLRRRLQFGLRSILLLTFVVAVWLSFEVSAANRTQRHVAAIRKLGGEVEDGANSFSLLRFVDRKYGRRISKITIPGRTAMQAVEHLYALGVPEREVVYDGSCDLCPELDQIIAALPRTTVNVSGTVADDVDTDHTLFDKRLMSKLDSAGPAGKAAQDWLRNDRFWEGLGSRRYSVVWSTDKCWVEVIVFHRPAFSMPGTEKSLILLLCRDTFRDSKQIATYNRTANHTVLFEDLDKDGHIDIGIECTSGVWGITREARQFGSDSRYWFDVFAIGTSGFRPILDELGPRTRSEK